MKLATFRHGDTLHAGVVEGALVRARVSGPEAAVAVRRFIESGCDAAVWRGREGASFALDEVTLLAPIPEPRRDLFCVGKNYRPHADEFHASGFDSTGKEAVPAHPVVFTKATTAVIGPGADIRAGLDPTGTVDYEGELGVVIGRRSFKVDRDRAMERVFGYVLINDVTSRALQQRHNQWVIGKGLDSFGPMGPWIATRDELADIEARVLETRVNGEVRQRAAIGDLIFDIPTLIATLSATMTLLPGDIIATGTPAGVGIGFDPPRYLQPGDLVEVRLDGLGTLANTVVDGA
jgi:2-keto-4-pentenoate hydratase/2-oxohepta-3-ene-1,7-dioic acid hydratase in catechol pathway